MNIISLQHVSKTYPRADAPALRNISFLIHEHEFVCIIGPSGCGKSTILKIIAGLESASEGTVLRPNRVGVVFQNAALLPWATVYENVTLPLIALNLPEHVVHTRALKYIDMLGLSEFTNRYPRQLSGGQRQRVGIARALAVEPDVLLLDEPFSALDAKTTDELHRDVLDIWKQTGQTIVMISHSIEEAVTLADRIILMKNSAIDHTFDITLPRPRREDGTTFEADVMKVRREFFK